MNYELRHGDCLDVLRSMPEASVDSVVTDPPYGLAFMGKKWDYDVPSEEIWRECLRVLKPGGHLLAFAGTRTQHRMAVRIEDAGFEIRDMIAWVYGSGFPKSLDVSKAIDRAAGAEREVLGYTANARPNRVGKKTKLSGAQTIGGEITAPATDAAKQLQGWGTALKPAMEPITVARKPLCGTVAENVLAHGTGGINVDGCRVGTDGGTTKANIRKGEINGERAGMSLGENISFRCDIATLNVGRWPANVIHDGSDEVVGLFPSPHGAGFARLGSDNPRATNEKEWQGPKSSNTGKMHRFGDSGSAARFFYCAKASKADRDEGCEGLEAIHRANGNKWTDQDYRVANGERPPSAESGARRNHHPTVKPTALMRYLCRLVTPPNGIVLDPFMGSGSTGKAAILEGFRFIGIEREADYIEIAKARIASTVDAAASPSNNQQQLW